ncbi:MAG TPA: gfo/Idh/MocA family oxidoreductase [Glaciecola sp.]|jgi:predicted dehydrogenase|nr:gfo/Idh/MocA family oxidoreductase [Glaciecola sp.]
MLNWGVIGCGHIANTFADGLACLDSGRLIACASNSMQRAKDWAENQQAQHHINKIYDNYQALVSDPEVQAVYIANTHNFHYESVKLCLQHQKHVLCEKPITLNAKQAAELYSLAQTNKCFLMEAVWTRFLPAIRMLQKALSDNVIGDVLSLRADFSINRMLDESHRLRNKQLAGGALLDLGIYPVSFSFIVFGEAPEKIQSSAVMDTTGVDKRSFYLFEYSDGRTASLSSAYSHVAPCEAIIAGSEGYIKVPQFLGAQEFTVHKEGQEPQTHSFPFSPNENFSFEIQHMHDCVAQGLTQSPILPHNESVQVMQAMDTLRAQWGLHYDGEQ